MDGAKMMRPRPSLSRSHLPGVSFRTDLCVASRIPTGFRHLAQGCEARATLGKRGKGNLNPEGVTANDRCAAAMQPRWGWKALAGMPRVASPTRQPLGWRTESRWDSPRSTEQCSARTGAPEQG